MALMNKCTRCNRTWKSGKDAPRRCPACDGTDVMLVTAGGSGGMLTLLVLVAVVGAGVWFGMDTIIEFIDKIDISQPDTKAPKAPKPPPPKPEPPKPEKPPASAEAPAEKPPAAEAPKPEAPPEPDDAAAKAAEKAKEEAAAREKAAERLANLAKNYEINNLRDQAIAKYKEVVEQYPGTAAAEQAKAKLEALQERK
jgi:hypothetical protein